MTYRNVSEKTLPSFLFILTSQLHLFSRCEDSCLTLCILTASGDPPELHLLSRYDDSCLTLCISTEHQVIHQNCTCPPVTFSFQHCDPLVTNVKSLRFFN